MISVSDNKNDEYIIVPTSKHEKTEKKERRKAKGFGVRHGQLIILFFCLATSFVARNHVGVTVVAMTSLVQVTNVADYIINDKISNTTNIINITEVNDINQTNDIDDLILNKQFAQANGNRNEKNVNKGNESKSEEPAVDNKDLTVYRTYNWTKPIHEAVMSSFYLGYSIAMLPMGLVCQRWGGKLPLQLSLLFNGVLTFITPWIALWGGWKAVSAARVLQGLSQAGTYPCIMTLISSWVPINERATMTSYVYSGVAIGNIIAFQVGGLLSGSAGGWPSSFWTVGLMCLACFIALTIFGAATPNSHATITMEEKILIKGNSDEVDVQKTKKKTPYKSILTSVPVWANFATQVGINCAYIFFTSEVASYNHYILGINVKNSGTQSSLPYVANLLFGVTYGNISDYLTQNNCITRKTARRLFNSICLLGMAACLAGVTFAHSIVTASLCFFILMASQAASPCGWMVNLIEIGANYTGAVMSIGNTLTNIVSLITPVLMSNIVVDVRNSAQWHTMLYLVAGLCLVTNIIFVVFLSVEDQPWNRQHDDEAEVEDNIVEGKITTINN